MCRLIILLLLVSITTNALAESLYQVGTSVGNVTPTAQALRGEDAHYMGGYGLWTERGPATGVHDHLTVRAICIENGDSFCLAVIDSLGIPASVVAAIQREVSVAAGLPLESILIAATHTHAAPDLLGLWGGAPAAYTEDLVRTTSNTIVSAWHGRVPARLRYAVTKASAHNRRGWPMTDDDLVVIAAFDPQVDVLIATLVNFAAHPVISPRTNLQLSSDYVHFLRGTIESETRAPTVFVNGAIGDVTPLETRGENYWQDAETYGDDLATRVISMLGAAEDIEGPVTLSTVEARIENDNLVLGIAASLGILNSSISGFPWNQQVATHVTGIRLGEEVTAVTVPGEASTRLGLSIKAGMTSPARMIFGLTHDSLGYFIPADEWETGRNGNYEESVSLGRSAADAISEAATRAIRSLAD